MNTDVDTDQHGEHRAFSLCVMEEHVVLKTLTKNTSKLSEKKIFQALQSIQTLNGADGNVFCPKWTSYRYKCWT